MPKFVALLIIAMPCTFVCAEQLIPTADGTTWRYDLTQEAGEGVTFSNSKAGPDGKVRSMAIYRIDGTQQLDGKNFLKFQMHRDGIVTNTDLMKVDERGISCAARIDQDGAMTKLDPVQIMVAAPLKEGASWDFDSKLGDSTVHQHYNVIGGEDVDLPAGKFHAFHIHGEQNEPISMIIDRWFVNGIGIVRDVTETRSPDGNLLRRISLELKEQPKVTPRPEVKLPATAKKISVSVGKEPIGQASTTQFDLDTPKIYARWQGAGLRAQTKIRVVWIAEDIGDVAPPHYTIDEASATASIPDSHGVFTLSRPEDGWAPGNYRIEFYLDNELVETIRVEIAK
jgi:hypothetical protein